MKSGYRDWMALGPVFVAAVVLVWHSLQFNFVTDDAYISFVYARNLAEHGELSFNLGQPVEGYTNFLWTVILAAFLLVGIAPEVSSLVLGTGFAIGTLLLSWFLTRAWMRKITAENARVVSSPEEDDDSGIVASIAPALLATSSSFACWASGGLETQMFCFWMVLALWLVTSSEAKPRRYRWLGVVLALASMTRPEGLLLVALFGLHFFVTNLLGGRASNPGKRAWLPGKEQWLALLSFSLLWLPWFLWRYAVYGYPFPNTYYVKAAGEVSASYADAMRDNGLHYIWAWARQTNILMLAPLALIGMFAPPLRSLRLRYGSLALTIAVTYVVYAVRVGGDFMGLFRFVLPATVALLILAALGAGQISRLFGKRRALASACIGIALVTAHAASQLPETRKAIDPKNLASDKGIDTPAYLDLYARDRARIGRHMRECFNDGDFSIFGGVGAKPYFARAEGIDVFGLVSKRIAHEVPRTRARPGHNKWGPDSLLLEYDPDFVFSCYSLHREADKPRWNCRPGFWTRRGYEPVTLHIPGLRERGEYYTFLAKKDRQFECPGRVR